MCNLCQLAHGDEREHLTEWFYLGLPGEVPEPMQGVVARDLEDKGYNMRLLWVPRRHVVCGDETREMKRTARFILLAVAQAVCVNKNLVISGFDFSHYSMRDHWHAQILLDLPQEVSIGLFR